jgi:hypothetical protein
MALQIMSLIQNVPAIAPVSWSNSKPKTSNGIVPNQKNLITDLLPVQVDHIKAVYPNAHRPLGSE